MIRYQDISVKFNGKYLFKNLNFTIEKGDKVLVYGRSGLGKSVLFKLLLGFIPPSEGTIYYQGMPIDAKRIWEVRQQIAYISQEVDVGSEKIEELLQNVVALKANTHIQFDLNRVKELLQFFQLPADTMEKRATQLSGGERQRVAIIIALLLQRQVFLLDEATAALDDELKEKVIDFFMANPEWTVLVISHDKHWMQDRRMKIYDLEVKGWRPQI